MIGRVNLSRAALAAALFLLTGVWSASAQQPSMLAKDWLFEHSPGMPAHPTQAAKGWTFAFPRYEGPLPCRTDQSCPGVHYLTTRGSPLVEGDRLMIAGKISATKGTQFHWETEAGDVPGSFEPRFRFMIQGQNDGCLCHEYGRWWSDKSIVTKPGQFLLTVQLTPKHWTSVYGRRADSSKAATAAWRAVLKNPARMGITFGGRFAGHGNNVRHGNATMHVTAFKVAPSRR